MDTHKYYQRPKQAGVDDRQAEAMTEGLATIAFGSLATKDDLKSEIGLLRAELGELRGGLKGEMGELRGELKGEMAELRMEMQAGFQRLFVRVTG